MKRFLTAALISILIILIKTIGALMAKLDDVVKAVTDEGTQIDAVSTKVAALKQEVADALAKAGVSAEDQAKIDAIAAQVEANKQKLAAVIGGAPDPSAVQQ